MHPGLLAIYDDVERRTMATGDAREWWPCKKGPSPTIAIELDGDARPRLPRARVPLERFGEKARCLRMGPTVCELEGPTPRLKMSRTSGVR